MELKKAYRKRRRIREPWYAQWRGINRRCTTKSNKYYRRGIKNFLSIDDVKTLWFRDRAYFLTKPSLDRIDSRKNYTLENCEFIELKENIIKGNKERHTK